MKKITVCTGKEELQLLPHQIPGFLASLDAKKTKIALKAKCSKKSETQARL